VAIAPPSKGLKNADPREKAVDGVWVNFRSLKERLWGKPDRESTGGVVYGLAHTVRKGAKEEGNQYIKVTGEVDDGRRGGKTGYPEKLKLGN